MKKIFLSILFLFLFPVLAQAEQVTLAWDANTESDLAGYKIYKGVVSADYDNSIDVGNITTRIILNLIQGETYYFAATAYDTSGNESIYSDEISYTVPIIDVTPPGAPKNFRKVVIDVTMNKDGVRVVVKAK